MVRRPRTIHAALVAGFLVLVGVWLASTFYVTRHLSAMQARSAAIHARYAKGQQLLSAVRSQVLLGSIFVRDALIEADLSFTAAANARDHLRSLQSQVDQELEQYRAIDATDPGSGWSQLEAELRDYWEAAVRLIAVNGAADPGPPQERLHSEVIPKRDVILELSDDIRRVMDEAVVREQAELETANRQIRRRVWETTGVAVLAGLAIAGVATWYVWRLESAVADEHAHVARHRLELRELSGRLVRAQEDERRTISRELHDEIGQALTAVDVELAVAAATVASDSRAADAIREARAVTQRALGGVRDLSQLLRPSMLDDFGLPETLKWYLRKFSDRTGIRTELVEEGARDRLPIDVEVCVYRAIQEALTNVSRHSGATSCRVRVDRGSQSLTVSVEDDGVGLPPPRSGAAADGTGVGLVGIRERVADLGGTFAIGAGPGRGTRLAIELPLATGG